MHGVVQQRARRDMEMARECVWKESRVAGGRTKEYGEQDKELKGPRSFMESTGIYTHTHMKKIRRGRKSTAHGAVDGYPLDGIRASLHLQVEHISI
jgi:hypothetical protein